MLIPVLVTPSAAFNNGPENSAFQFGDKICTVLFDSDASAVVAYLSDDNGATWVESDNANAPTTNNNIDTCFDASTGIVYALHNNNAVGGQSFKFTPFDMVTGLWGTTLSQVYFVASPNSTTAFEPTKVVDGKICGAVAVDTGAGTFYQAYVYDIGSDTVTAPIDIGPPELVIAAGFGMIVQGASDSFHAIFGYNNSIDGSLDIAQQRIYPDGTTPGVQIVLEIPGFETSTELSATSDGHTIVIAQVSDSDKTAMRVFSGTSADTIAFTQVVVAFVVNITGLTVVTDHIIVALQNGTADDFYLCSGAAYETQVLFGTNLANVGNKFNSYNLTDGANLLTYGSVFFWFVPFGSPPSPGISQGIITLQYPILLPNPAYLCVNGIHPRCHEVKCCDNFMLKTKEIMYGR